MFKTDVTRRYSIRPYRTIDFCKYYKMEDVLENLSFNKRFSNPLLKWALRKKYNYTKRLYYSISERIVGESNMIFVIYGTPNSGKSEGAQTIALYIKSKFKKYLDLVIKIHIAVSTADFQTILTEMGLGDIGIRDESPKLAGLGSKNNEKYLDNITKIVRQNQNSFIFIDPVLIETDVVSYYLEAAGKYKGKRKTRFILYDKHKQLLGHVYLELHNNEQLREEYKRLKTANIEGIMANAGMVTPEINSIRLLEDIAKLTEYCIEEGLNKKGAIFARIPLYNAQFTRQEDMIKGDTNYMKILVENVYIEIKKMYSTKAIEIKSKTKIKVTYKEGQSFSEWCRVNIADQDMAKVAEGLARGDSYNTIDANYSEFKYNYVQKTADWLRSEANVDTRLGFIFEKWYALSIGVPLNMLDELLGGTKNDPDLIWNDIIYSLKFRINQKSITHTFNQSTDLGPEYREAIKRGCTYILVFMNPKWSLHLQERELDPVKDPEEVVLKKSQVPVLDFSK